MDSFNNRTDNMAYNNAHRNSALSERLAEYMDCPCRLIPQGTGINEVNQKYLSVLRYGMEHGSTPVLIPVKEPLINHLRGGQGFNINAVRQQRRSSLWELNADAGKSLLDAAYEEKSQFIAYKGVDLGDFENGAHQGVAVNCFSSFLSGGRTNCEVLLAQVPTANPWEIFIWLPVGGLNGAPANNELAAVSKRWNELCGALPAVVGYGVVEYFIPRGKPDPQTAKEIAKGQFAICPERTLCMTRSHTASELADTLTKSCVWYLGWRE